MQSVEAASAAPSSTSKNCTKHDGMHHASDSEKPWMSLFLKLSRHQRAIIVEFTLIYLFS